MALWYCDSQRPSEQRAFCHDIILRNLVWSLKQIYDPGTHRESTWLTNLPAYETDFFFKKGQLGLATHRRRSASLKSSVERCSCMARASIIGNLPPLGGPICGRNMQMQVLELGKEIWRGPAIIPRLIHDVGFVWASCGLR